MDRCVHQWKEFEDSYDMCAAWVKDTEATVKSVELKSNLPEKKEQHDKLRVSSPSYHYTILEVLRGKLPPYR